MPHKLELSRKHENILASADEHGVSVYLGWTVGIPATIAQDYVRNYNSSPDAGFFEQGDKVVLSHGSAKLTLTRQEADALLSLIRTAYGTA